MTEPPRPRLGDAKRVIVKIGSALLADPGTGGLRQPWFDALIDDIAALRRSGQQVIIVSSGAVALGRHVLGLQASGQSLALDAKQAAAATGQVRLAHGYQNSLARHGLTAAQLLVSPGDTEDRRRHLNVRATLERLLELGVVPVVNENDTVATDELRFGDNDRLAARIAQMASADVLVLLSDVDGLYSADPRSHPDASHIPMVRGAITPAIAAMAGLAHPGDSSGGMVTKLEAARIALAAGCAMVIAEGSPLHPLAGLDDADRRKTWFQPDASPLTARKRWIAGHLDPRGQITVDAGAVAALGRGKSLLPAGVTGVDGAFQRGDLVRVLDATGQEVARGLVGYDAGEARRIIGAKSDEIAERLGYIRRPELIHRDDLVMG